ncbi:siderophore-interacting protein [Empedobacter brevis]|uniref:siderophore-interacting protein n=1 Tax=Empedobacter brevis TaxID=247 RepID=UPI0028AC952B|nr:siderophore-interacting protein [Empedobacter brevis]
MNNIPILRTKFNLVRKQNLTPHLIRVTLKCDDVSPFKMCTLGVNNKIFVPPVGVEKVYFSENDPVTGELILPPIEVRPSIRTYTHRAIDIENNLMMIDFVNHGENGPASRWAIHAEIGTEIGVAMKLKSEPLHPTAEWYFLIGDATAIPVISCILEALPADANGIVILETFGKEDELELVKPQNIEIVWLHNKHPEKGSELAENVKMISVPEGCTKFAYVAAEFATVKELRTYFRKELNWSNTELYAYSYWKSGVAEDKSVEERHLEKNS